VGSYQENVQGHKVVRVGCACSLHGPVAVRVSLQVQGSPRRCSGLAGSALHLGPCVVQGLCREWCLQWRSSDSELFPKPLTPGQGSVLLEQGLWASRLCWHPAGLAGFKMNWGELYWVLVSSPLTVWWGLPLDFPSR